VTLGSPRVHLRRTDSTNVRARELAAAGAPHGTVVTATEQTAGRGRQGRVWVAPAGRALLCSVVIRDPPRLLPLATGVAVADSVEAVIGGPGRTAVKWPNDIWLDGRKVAGILVEGRPQEGWAVIGIGLNVALRGEASGRTRSSRRSGGSWRRLSDGSPLRQMPCWLASGHGMPSLAGPCAGALGPGGVGASTGTAG
jgi:biotin-[acetyl-CoA-carboxylase] ligase BirA-like protein